MKKILHINCTDCGSTGKIIIEISKVLKNNGWDSILCAAKLTNSVDDFGVLEKFSTTSRLEAAIFNRLSRITGLRYAVSPFATKKICDIIHNEKPDVIHLHAVVVFMANIYKILKFANKENIPVVITNHAEFYYTGTCAHANECMQWVDGCKKCDRLYETSNSLFIDRTPKAWRLMKKSLQSLKRLNVVSVSPWVYNRSKKSGIMYGIQQSVVKNGIDINVFKPIQSKRVHDRIKNNSCPIVFFPTAMFTDKANDPKGGHFIIELARKTENEFLFVVAGRNNVSVDNLPSNLLLLGEISDQTLLAEYYSKADLSVIVSKRETFSMCLAESLCCGTPVVGFFAGGPESIALEKYCNFVQFGDLKKLLEIIRLNIGLKNSVGSDYIGKEASKIYSSEVMANEYLKIYEDIIKK